MRIAVLLSGLLFAGCTVGEVGGGSNNNNPPGADAGGGTPDGMAAANGCVTRGTAADPHLHLAGGTSNKDQSCVAGGCHLTGNLGAGAPAFTFAGTVYKADHTTPNAGANITIYPNGTGAGTPALTLIADTDGNFYTSEAMPTFPATTAASACPDIQRMATLLSASSASGPNCNGCHIPGGTGLAVITAP